MTHEVTLPSESLPALDVAAVPSDQPTLDTARVFAEHADYVWNTLRRLGTPRSDLEDLTHDTFLAVFRAWDDYDPARPLRPWLFVFALRASSDHRRRARHRVEVPHADEPPDSAPGAVELLLRKEREALAHEALNAIVLSRRAVFILHELDGCTVPEIATALEIPVATAYSRLRLAREDFAVAVRRLTLRSR
jgi:RNA polymerase sigma-70 factor (ECF subfamily)